MALLQCRTDGLYARLTRAGLVLSALLLATIASAVPPLIRIDGSSTVYPVSEAVAEDFLKVSADRARVTVGIAGTGGGFKKFCRGEIEIVNASRPISREEADDCRAAGIGFIEMPVAYDALTVVINPANDWARSMTVGELKAIWEPAAQGRIRRWRDVNPAWPDRPLNLYGPGADSGSFEYFTEAINGRPRATRTDYSASEDDNVLVQGIARDPGGLGYLGYSYYLENREKIAAVAIVSGAAKSAKAIAPSAGNVGNGSYRLLARPLLVYASAVAAERPEVMDFIRFYLTHAATLAEEVKVIPLPAAAYADARDRFLQRVVGSRFGGQNRIGLTIEALMQLEAR